jgi:hypothetical protein
MKTWQLLGYLGLIPFILCILFPTELARFGLNNQHVFIAYSAVILSFVAGTLWRVEAHVNHKTHQIVSNIFSLVAFASLLASFYIAVITLAISYLLLFLYEYKCTKQHSLQSRLPNYMAMRFRLTLIVVLLHIFAFLS